MRTIINYIRSCFCKHEYELIKEIHCHDELNRLVEVEWIYRCKKCNHHCIELDH